MIPDLALQTVIVGGLRATKRNPRRVDQLFANLPVEIRAQVREFLVGTPIHFTHGYPMETPKLPHVILVLRREDEAEAVLGQTVDGGPIPEEEFLLRDADLGAPRPPPRSDPAIADELIEDRAAAFPDDAVPLLYGERDGIESIGRVERITYEAEIRTQDYFATAFLHRVIKALLIAAVPRLEAWGIHDLQLSGLDLQHEQQDYPHAVFSRTLALAFQYVFGIHEPQRRLSAVGGQVTAVPPGAAVGEPGVTLAWQITIT